jgi:hypothetical protein
MVPVLARRNDPMTKLSDTQVIILSAAAQRDDGNVLPLPSSLRGGAANKVVGALLSRELVAEHVSDNMAKADPALNRIWRNDPDGHGVLLTITTAGLKAIGLEPAAEPEAANGEEPTARAPAGAEDAPVEPAPKTRRGRTKVAPSAADTAAPRKSRDGTKQAQLIAMLRRPGGATIAQIVEATGWQPHTVRGAFAGALKKKLGLEVTSEKAESGERIYRLPPA